MRFLPRFAPLTALALALVLAAGAAAAAAPRLERAPFGRTPEGAEVEQFTLTNRHGATARIITFGAIVADLRMPDRAGHFTGVVREMTASPEAFQRGFPQSAAVFGRYANRIALGRFTLDGTTYQLTVNNGRHILHGGRKNFSRVVWSARPLPVTDTAAAVELTYRSADGEEGFPGNVTVTVTYTLTDANTLRLDYRATTDKPTPINLTNHAYFNLAGSGDVRAHTLTVAADRTTAVDADLIPTGELLPVRGTFLDFTTAQPLGARAAQLPANRRYDHNFVLNRPDGDASLRFAARVADPGSGRTLDVWTTEPGVQLYTSPLREPTEAEMKTAFYCLETQHFPDSPNHPHFPSTILRPGETFRSTTEFRFGVQP